MALPGSLAASLRVSSRRLYLQAKHTVLPVPSHADIVPKACLQPKQAENCLQVDYEARYREEKMSREYAERQLEELRERMKFYEGIEEELKAVKLEKETVLAELETERLRNSAKSAQIGRVEADQTALISALKGQIAVSSSEITDLKAQLNLTHSHYSLLQTTFESSSKAHESTTTAFQAALDEERKSKREVELLYAELWDTHQTCCKENWQVLERAKDQECTLLVGDCGGKRGLKDKRKRTK